MSYRSTWQSARSPGGIRERRRFLALLAFGVAGALGACGKKGPPRLPEPAASAPASPAPASPDEETE